MEYREATLNDINDLVLLCRHVYLEADAVAGISLEHVASRFIHLIIAAKSVVYVAKKEDVLVGFIGGSLTEYIFSPETIATEDAWFVAKEHRKGMTGAKLLKLFYQWGKDHGAAEVQCGVSTGISTERTSKLIERLGFNPAGNIFKKKC